MDVLQTKPSLLSHILFVVDNYVRYIVSKSLVIILSVYSFYSTWEVILFVALEYPKLYQEMSAGLITQERLNYVMAGVLLTVFATFISAFFAIRLNSTQEKITHTIDIIITTLLIVFQSHIRAYLLTLDVLAHWPEYFR
jgi:DNA integrity scanning protein DisA with diadenylate cyclase activity